MKLLDLCLEVLGKLKHNPDADVSSRNEAAMSMEGFSDGQAAAVPHWSGGWVWGKSIGVATLSGGKAGTAPACHTFHLADSMRGSVMPVAPERAIGPSSADG